MSRQDAEGGEKNQEPIAKARKRENLKEVILILFRGFGISRFMHLGGRMPRLLSRACDGVTGLRHGKKNQEPIAKARKCEM